MRRKKLLRQIAAAAVALSMAASLSAPAFAATFDLSNGGLVITADESGITVKQDGQDGVTSIADNEEIEIKGTYSSANGATQTAEENQQEENQPVTPAKAPAKEETSEETSGTENAPAAEKKQEQKDTEAPADPEQNTETENKDNNSDPDNEEKKEQNAPANGELNASAGEGQEPKAEDEGQPKPEAKASAEATASASDDASNGPRKAPARSSGEGKRAGIVQIINNTAKKIKVSLSNAHIDLPTAADTSARGQAAIDVQGGDVELKFSGSNTLTGSGGSAGIQKNDKTQDGKENTGTLTITADSKSDTLNVKVDEFALGQDNQGAAIGGGGRKTDGEYGGYGTKNIVIEGNGTVNTNAQIGSGFRGGAATGIVIQGNAVVNVGDGGIGGIGLPEWYGTEKPGETDVTITGNANVTVKNGTIGSGVRRGEVCGNAKIEISENAVVNVEGGDNAAAIGSGAGGDANVTITGNAKVTAVQKSDWYGGGAGIGGGCNRNGSHITINGGTVTAEGGDHGAGIGGGAKGSGSNVTVSGAAQVTAIAGKGDRWDGAGATIGSGSGGSTSNPDGTFTPGSGQEIQANISGLITGWIHHIIYDPALVSEDNPDGILKEWWEPERPQPNPEDPNAPAEESNEVSLGTPGLHVETLEGDLLPFDARQQGGTLRVTSNTLAARLHGTRQALEALQEQGVEQIVFVTTLKTTTLSVAELLAEGGSWFALEHNGLGSRRLSAAQAESLKCQMH